ncbi:non-ribosomal peptide synthetase [Pseudoduganella namucuonensis]|uniref:Yersiniabactin nonribosomal peptide synthetase n=1 Tax=Pseudoduganella namucuonensis TaxID=1035707 RepID=A0A1I7FKN5_9BURK|nr:non-ribosomal peptide synthetase [Pseudoduganella namucuonensis]SFU36724.1 yersiniabactin nonribosomal peptide synthetase [Pseudoduganella namucuonensis]
MIELLEKLRNSGIQLRLEGAQLRVVAPKGALTADLREVLTARKEELLDLLRGNGQEHEHDLPPLTQRPDLRHESFALTDVQQAYWMGRNDYVELGGFSTHFYIELERFGLDVDLLERSLHKVIARHDMLRAVIEPDGRQKILPEVPPYRIAVRDLRGRPAAEQDAELDMLRRCMSHKRQPADRWPLFEVRAARWEEGRLRLFVSLDMLIIDASSMFRFFEDWQRFYEEPAWSPAPFGLSYRDYAAFELTLQDQPAFQRAKDYWAGRLDGLPAAPALPLAVQPRAIKRAEFHRRLATLPAEQWQSLKSRARQHGGTATVLLMTAFSDVLRTWSKEPDFTLNVTMFNRAQIHPDVNRLIGDFTTTNLLAVHAKIGESFVDRMQRLQKQLAQDLNYRQYSGMRVLRDRARKMGNAPGAAMPIVFTSTLALDSQQSTTSGISFFGDYVYGVSQTPQVWLDHQMVESDGELMLFWDAIEALFPEGMLDDMFSSYVDLLKTLAEDAHAWTRNASPLSLPRWQEEERRAANATSTDIPQKTLHGLVAEQAARTPDAPAVIAESVQLSYAELHRHAYRLARHLRELGARPNGIVAVAMEKGWEQIAAIFGILHSGAAYLPIDPSLPQERRHHLVERSQATVVVTQRCLTHRLIWPEGVQVVTLDDEAVGMQDDSALQIPQSPQDLAYVLFTSGSTGQPKGVMIEHRNAGNTVQDINRRFNTGPHDRMLALSAAHFDLSVYDLFGVLGGGGALVIPSAERLTDPAHWTELVRDHGVTLWNSVPQLLQLWAEHLHERGLSHPALRWTILSGDWIPVELPDQVRAVCPNVQILASGGPTETSIWCTQYPIGEVRPEWKSIPYGKPLSNQTMYVYDELLEPRPVWTTGEIHVGGIAVGRGYLNDPERTTEKFIVHPQTGERLYKSGDLGRYLPGGDIEFLGREDFQVKVNGYRIELGEIESVLRRQPSVREAVVTVSAQTENGQRQLVAYVVPNAAEGWESLRLADALTDVLPSYMVPHHYVRLDALPLSANGKLDYKALPPPLGRETEKAKPMPCNADEQRLFDIWKVLLGHEGFGVEDNFFSLGADSINMVQMMAKAAAAFELPGIPQQRLLQRFFAGPTIAAFAATLREFFAESGGVPKAGPADEPLPDISPDRENWYEPFPLSDLQGAYLTGQMEEMEYHVNPNYYLELDLDESLEGERYERALNAMLARQKANLPILTEDLRLRVPRTFVPVRLQVNDLRGLDSNEVEQALLRIRDDLERTVMPLDCWPWVAFQISLHGGKTRLHINTSNFFLDAFGALRLTDSLHYYHHPDKPLPELTISYRDGVLAYKQIESSSHGKKSERYWRERIQTLPGPPSIPLLAHENPRSRSVLRRRELVLPEKIWGAFKQRASRHGITATNAVYAVYAEILAHWSGSRHFLLSSMLTQRLPLHPRMRDIIGNFAAVYPLEVDWRGSAPFYLRARNVQMQLIQDAQHIYWGSARVWQALNHRAKTPGRAVSPFVVVSGLDMAPRDRRSYGCLETPQVLIDQQLWNLADGSFWAIWDVNERFFPPGVVDAMWQAYGELLTRLAEDDSLWQQESFDLLPATQRGQREQRDRISQTAEPLPEGLLHDGLACAAVSHPNKSAVISAGRTLSYAELNRFANQLGHCLLDAGAKPNELVAILLGKGWEQVVAAFGILASGAAYVPIDPDWPEERVHELLRDAETRLVVTSSKVAAAMNWPAGIHPVCIDDGSLDAQPDTVLASVQQPTDLAYVIYTSGSTGKPKGVMIDHQGALNTVLDVNRRFGVGASDVVLGVSALQFDLSVYDLFGTVAAAATLVLPKPSREPAPTEWVKAVREHRVTVWNSVPALMQLLVEAASDAQDLASLRKIMLSGDWIPLPLPALIRQIAPRADLISMGGATEASIWSIYHPIGEIDPLWTSVPYGRPLANQTWHVLNDEGADAPDWVQGNLYIGGIGLAQGYWRDIEKTERAFVRHPRTGERLYRTGDLGRYLPDGTIEFLGRADFQVKVRGYRIELGEIEQAMLTHPGVQTAIVSAQGERAGRQLVAFVVQRPGEGCDAAALQAHLRAKLPGYMVPERIDWLTALPLTANGKVDRAALDRMAPMVSEEKRAPLAPRTPVETELVRIWEDILAVSPIGVQDDFFELGGQSFAAIQVMTRIERQLGRRLSLGTLLEGRTVEHLARRLELAQQWTPLAPIKPDGQGHPLFLVHPAGGNVLCYRELAQQLSMPVHGLQAAGLSGEQPAMDDLEKMAALYLDAVRQAQPQGPYRLGGWSSGGTVAFEMARQLEDQGETVQQVIAIDTPAPLPQDESPDRAAILSWFLRDLNIGLDPSVLEQDALRGATLADALGMLRQKQGAGADLTPELLQPVFEVFAGVLAAVRRYRPRAIRADMLVLKAGAGQVDEFRGHPAAGEPDWGWRQFTRGAVQAQTLAGTHYSLLLPPRLKPVADVIQQTLEGKA